MWKMMTLSFLICIFKATLIRVQVAADAATDCAACTAAYDPTSDKDCEDLKKYLNCLETAAGTTDWCTLSTEEAQNVAKATCMTPLESPCTCLKDFWGSECRSLEHYTQCLNTASDAACEGGLKASELVTRADGRSDPKCGTATSTSTTTTTTKGNTGIFKATLIRDQVAADAAVDCAACTAAYDPTLDNKDCLDLKKYLNCLETAAGTTDWCTLSTEEAQNVAKATCMTPLEAPCTCLKDFWGSECRSLEHYTQCLNTASDAACEGGLKASELVTRADGRSDPKCGTATSTSTTTTTTKGSGASPLGMYSAIASFLPFVLTAFRL